MEKEEIWKDVVGYEGIYKVSNLGNVKSLHWRNSFDERIMTPHLLGRGYYFVNLRNKSKGKSKLVHRLVAQAFIPNPNNYPCVNHKDENKLNNCVDNLEWCSYLYNNTYGKRKGIWKGKNNPNYKDGKYCLEQ